MARRAYLAVAVLLVGGLVVQVFLAGLGVFDSAARFSTHRDWGYLLELFPFLLFLIGLVGRLGRRFWAAGAGIFALFMLQSILIAVRTDLPMVAALHPVNGFLIVLVTVWVAREAWLARNLPTRSTASSPLAESPAG